MLLKNVSQTNEKSSCDITLDDLAIECQNSYLSADCIAFIKSDSRIYKEDGPILYIDDQESVLKIGGRIIEKVLNSLKLNHISVVSVLSVNQAFRYLTESEGVSCIIVDGEMPHFITESVENRRNPTGVSFAKVVKSHLNGSCIPIFLSSGTHCLNDQHLPLGYISISPENIAFFNGDILKPVTSEKLTPVFETLYFDRKI